MGVDLHSGTEGQFGCLSAGACRKIFSEVLAIDSIDV